MKSKTIAKNNPKAAPKAEAAVKAAKIPAKAIAKAEATKAEAAPNGAKKADARAKAEAFAIHVNKTGRVCFGKLAAARLGNPPYCALTIDGKIVRLEPTKKADGAIEVHSASGRPYISATRQFKPLGFDGSRPYDIEAKAYGAAGFEFRLA